MIVEKKNKNKSKKTRTSQAASQLTTTTTMQANTSAAAANLSRPTMNDRRRQPLGDIINSSNMDHDNDEENIVIDMCDEDEDLDLEDRQAELFEELQQDENHNNSNNNNNNDDANFYAKQKQSSDYQRQSGQSQNSIVSNYDFMHTFNAGDLIWFDPNLLGYSIPGKVLDVYADLQLLTVEGYAQPNELETGDADHLEAYNRLLSAADEQLQVYDLSEPLQLSTIKLRRPLTEAGGKIDLIRMDELSLESIIWNLKLRYKQDLIYTNCGAKILLSVNPFKQLNSIYDLDQANKYDSFDSSKLRLLNKFELSSSSDGEGRSWSKLLRWLLLSKQSSNDIMNQPAQEEESHIFGLAKEALMKLLISGQDQCFVLLGESGSGKTEACKLLVQYLASINKSPTNLMTEQILESIQVLESFGNAKTIHNDNSSRFGKLLEIEFSLSNGFIKNAKTIELNLLDRSRIVGQVEQERNYHVFYELLQGLSVGEKEKYGLQTAEKYFYLNQGNCVELQTKEDGEDFRSLLASMQVLGFNYEEQDTIFRVLASVLHLGNIYFHRKVLAVRSGKLANTGEPAAAEGVEVGSDTEVRWISHLLQIQFDSVMRCLTVRTTETHSSLHQDKIVTPLNIDQALDTRDVIARTLYNCLFKWLVQRINVMISAGKPIDQDHDHDHDNSENQRQAPYNLCRTSESLCEFQPDKLGPSSRDSTLRQQTNAVNGGHHRQQLTAASISILDSFGFENLHENNFEQLCINYSAELLQYHTSRYLLRLEQGEYTKERLKWSPLGSPDHLFTSGTSVIQQQHQVNAPPSGINCVVNLLSKKPLGILALLDDECNFPKATDQSFVEKCHHNHTLNENYQRARLSPNCSQEFGVRHFRQQTKLVWYQVDGFIEKNRDTLRADILDLLLNSKMSIVVDMLRKLHRSSTLDLSGANGPTNSSGKTLSRTYDGRYVSMKPRATTVAAKFQDTLQNNKVLESMNPKIPAAPAPSISDQQQQQQQQRGCYTRSPADQAATLVQRPGEPWFIVCLKPNRSRTPALFDVGYVQDQAISMNLHEIAQIRQRGYPFKMRFDEFVREYMCLVPSRFLQSMSVKKGQVKRGIRDVCKSIVEYAATATNIKNNNNNSRQLRQEFQCGLTKLFMSERLFYQLERRRLQVHQEAINLLQRTIRMWLARGSFLQLRAAATVIQAHWRAYAARREFWRQYALIVCLQRRWRHQLELRHQRHLEQQRQMRRKQQQVQLQELQKKQRVNQFRFRQHQPPPPTAAANQIYASKSAGLDIPNDLAQLYRLQRDWLPVHDLSHLHEINDQLVMAAAAAAQQSPESQIEEFESDNRFPMQEFLEKYYTNDTAQFGYSRLIITRPFNWPQLVERRKLASKRAKKEPDPMLRSELITSVKQRFESIKSKSIAMYKLILRYIDSDDSRIEQESDAISASQKLIKFKLLADYVIYLCIGEPLLRDEIYLQLASLSWQNPKQKSSENCWRFMMNCLSCFGPESRTLTRYLLRFSIDNCCYEKYRLSLLQKLAHYLSSSSENSRKFPPSMLEYRANSRGIQRLALAASTHDPQEEHQQTIVPVEAHTTGEQFAHALLKSRNEAGGQNFFGWTVEILPSKNPSDDELIMPCQLRGDNKILDHFSEIELQPELVQRIQEPLLPSISDCDNLNPHYPPSKQSDYETIAPMRHQELMAGRRVSAGETSSLSYKQVSPDLELSPRASGLSQTSRLNRRYLQQQQQQHYDSGDYAPYNQPRLYHEHYDEPMQPPMKTKIMTSKNQFNRRSMSMEGLQLASSALNGRYLNGRQAGSNHYACSLSFACDSASRRRSQTPTYYSNHFNQQQRMSSSAYGSEPYHQGPSSASAQQHHYQQLTGSLSRDMSSGRRPRRSASSSLLAPPARGKMSSSRGNYCSDYASACCSDYERIPVMAHRQGAREAFATRPLPTQPSGSSGIGGAARPGQSRRPPGSSFKPNKGTRRGAGAESHYVASSAMSDTSEAPSLASHVRRVKVPQANGDLDQYLDDLFNPMLNEDLGEMSDARSLAPSMRGLPSSTKLLTSTSSLLENLCDPNRLSKIIRGRDESTEDGGGSSSSCDERREPLSPTFESLLTSLRHGDGGVRGMATPPPPLPTIEAHQLGEMNIGQLRALNEKLEHEITTSSSQSSSNRSSQATITNESFAQVAGCIPAPPPQPNFEAQTSSSVMQSSLFEDLYDRAKTIRVGKVRWPPQKDAPSQQLDHSKEVEAPEQQANIEALQTEKRGESAKEIKIGQVDSQPLMPLMSGSVGKLKISSEMKAKLEQLTNSNSSESSPPPPLVASQLQQQQESTGSGIVSQAKSSLMASTSEQSVQVKRLAMQRKHLLEAQLLGSSPAQSEGGAATNRDSFGGGKVMAAKQQLAAAAGVALALLDSGSACNSQASSRRQSTALSESKVRHDLQADELGPQSRSAISQRQAFYHQSMGADFALDGAGTQPEVIVEEPPAAGGGSVEPPIPAPAPLPTAVSSDNLLQKQPAQLTRAMQMSSNLNEAGIEPIGQVSERPYGRLSIAKTHAQRQQEQLQHEREQREEARDWIASSPDQHQRAAHLQQNNKRSAPSGFDRQSSSLAGTNNYNKRPRSSKYQQQQATKRALTYSNVDWQLKVRKEFFLPSESYDNPLMLQLIFSQLVADVSRPQQMLTRLNNKERAALRSMLKENSIGPGSLPQMHQLDQVKRDLTKLARSFGLYFTRSYECQNYALLAEDPSFYGRRAALFDDLWKEKKKRTSSLYDDDDDDNRSDSRSSNDPRLSNEEGSDVQDDDLGRGQQTTSGSKSDLAGKLLDRLRNANNLGLNWIDLVAVHHSGLRLVVAIPAANHNNNGTPTQQQQHFGYKVLETLKYRDMTDVSLVGERELLVSMRNGRKCWLLSSDQATQLSKLLRSFHSDYNSQPQKALAQANNISSSGSQQATSRATSEAGNNKKQLKQQDFDEDEDSLSLQQHQAHESDLKRDLSVASSAAATTTTLSASSKQVNGHEDDDASARVSSKSATSSQQQDDGKHSLLQFALYNFREAIDKYSLESRANKQSGDLTYQAVGDTSTLRGSLKLIETLRRSRGAAELTSSGTTSSRSKGSSKVNKQQVAEVASDWTWRELAQMVKFTVKPVKSSLLKLPSADLNKRAVDCFASIMQYMGDLPGNHASSKLNEVECVYLILMNCHNFPILRDEIYCQLMKQTTNNRSEQQDSCLRGWRLFSMLAAYFDCSDLLKPYLLKYLETAAYDKRRAYCSVALICLQNLRKTFKFGGRKNVPSIEEIAATSAGRNSKRQIYRLPGGTERVINTKSSTVVEDIIYEICSSMLSVSDSDEMLEFSLYCIADGDLYTMPLNRDEYILDITTELIKNHQQYFLIFCRSIWHYPLKLDSKLYIEVIFNQIAPDYLEGLLLVLPDQQQQQKQRHARRLSSASSSFSSTLPNHSNQDKGSLAASTGDKPSSQSKYQLRLRAKLVKEIARIAALLHRASGTDYMPHRDEVKYLLPKPIIAAMKQSASTSSSSSSSSSRQATSGSHLLTATEQSHESVVVVADEAETVVTTPQKWVELVQDNWRDLSAFDTLEAKAQFLEIVRHWPLFGSSFFAIKLIQRDLIQPMEFILALNKLGIQMLDLLTHETIHKYPFNEVISTRKVRSEDGALFLDMKCGNLLKRTIIRIQTDQAHEISRLIRQYIDIELIQQNNHHNNNNNNNGKPPPPVIQHNSSDD